MMDEKQVYLVDTESIEESWILEGSIWRRWCNDPKPLCKDHHCFGVFLKLFLGCGILSNTLLNYLFRCVYMKVYNK